MIFGYAAQGEEVSEIWNCKNPDREEAKTIQLRLWRGSSWSGRGEFSAQLCLQIQSPKLRAQAVEWSKVRASLLLAALEPGEIL